MANKKRNIKKDNTILIKDLIERINQIDLTESEIEGLEFFLSVRKQALWIKDCKIAVKGIEKKYGKNK